MNTIRELKQQEKYKNMLKRKNKEKNIYKTQNETLRIKYEGIKKLLEKKDKEIERLNNIINESNKMIDKIVEEVYKPVDKEWDNILCIIEDYKLKLQELQAINKQVEELEWK